MVGSFVISVLVELVTRILATLLTAIVSWLLLLLYPLHLKSVLLRCSVQLKIIVLFIPLDIPSFITRNSVFPSFRGQPFTSHLKEFTLRRPLLIVHVMRYFLPMLQLPSAGSFMKPIIILNSK